MIGSSRAMRAFARNGSTDLRKGFKGPVRLVIHELGEDPLKGDFFLFVNRRRTSAKVLLWDGTGWIGVPNGVNQRPSASLSRTPLVDEL